MVLDSIFRRRPPVGPEPRCGACGYIVVGLPSSVCPECGSDLRRVGIITPKTPRRASLPVLAGAWTLLVFVAVTYPLTVAGSSMRGLFPRYEASLATRLKPRSQQYSRFEIDYAGQGKDGALHPDRLVLRLVDSANATHAVDAAAANSFTVAAPAGNASVHAGPFTRTDLAALFQAAGINPTLPAVAAEIDDLYQVTAILKSGTVPAQPFSGSPNWAVASSSRVYWLRQSAWLTYLWLLSIPVWILGLYFITLGRRTPRPGPRKPRLAPTSPQPPSP